jgi:hypothetical protein
MTTIHSIQQHYVKLVLEQTIQAQRGSEVGGQRQAPAALSPKMTQ